MAVAGTAPARYHNVSLSEGMSKSRLPRMAQAAISSHAIDIALRISQSRTKAMERAPGPASTTRASMPVALGTARMGGDASARELTLRPVALLRPAARPGVRVA